MLNVPGSPTVQIQWHLSRFFLPCDLLLSLKVSTTFILTWDLSRQEQDLHSFCCSAWRQAKNSLQLPVNQMELHQGWCWLKFLHQCSRVREEWKGKKGIGGRKKKRCAADLNENWLLPCHSLAGLIQKQVRSHRWSCPAPISGTISGIWVSSCLLLSQFNVITIRWLVMILSVCAEWTKVSVHEGLFLIIIMCIVTCHQQKWTMSISKLNHNKGRLVLAWVFL